MTLGKTFTSRIAGTGSAFPKRVVTNAELCQWLEKIPGEKIAGFGPEWIVERTGIETRHVSGTGETVSELSVTAANAALKVAGIEASALDGIILATCTPDQVVPAAATRVQVKLGAKNAFAFDLNAACSGFHHAWAMGHSLIASGQAKNLLIIGADVLSAITDYSDKKSAILFGDGAGAMVLSTQEVNSTDRMNSQFPKFILAADGEQRDLFEVPAGGSAKPHFGVGPSDRNDLPYSQTRMQMRGAEIYKSSVRTMVALSERLLAEAGLSVRDIDVVVPHQANLRILERVAKQHDLPMERFSLNISERGNTSAATVPTALDQGIRSGKIKRGNRLLIPVFGAGVTAGSATMIY